MGPTFDPTAAKAMSDELSRAEQGDASTARAHRLEDFEAARERASGKGSKNRVAELVRRLLGRGR
jgi:hypothetical protein